MDGYYYMATCGYLCGIWHAVEWKTRFTGLRIHGSGGEGGPAGGFLSRYSLLVAFRTTLFDIRATMRKGKTGRLIRTSNVALWEVKNRQAS